MSQPIGETPPTDPYDQLIAQLQGGDQIIAEAEAMVGELVAAQDDKIVDAERKFQLEIETARQEQIEIMG